MGVVTWSAVFAVLMLTIQGESTTVTPHDTTPDLPALPPCPRGQVRSTASSQCCPVCPPGTGATGACVLPTSPPPTTTTTPATTNPSPTPTNPFNGSEELPGCKPCAEGVTFSANHSHVTPCFRCSTCPKNARVLRSCNATHDTECECQAGLFYLSGRSGQCQLCDLCPAGWGVGRACAGGRNTECRQCRNGTYSDLLSATAACRPCRTCNGQEERTARPCTATRDTECVSKYQKIPPVYHFNGHNSRHHDDFNGQNSRHHDDFHLTSGQLNGLSSDRGQHHRDVTPDPDDDSVDVIPLYCAGLGAVVVGLLGYVISVHLRRMRVKRLPREPHEDVEYSKASGADSGIFMDSEHHHQHHHQHQRHHHQHHHHHHHHQHHSKQKYQCVLVTANTRLKDLPQEKKKELEMTFFAGSRAPSHWKALARELGYNSGKIATFETRSGGRWRGDPRAPFRQLLHDWGRLEGATVTAFQRALRSIGRHDVIKFLQAECEGHSQSVTAALPPNVV